MLIFFYKNDGRKLKHFITGLLKSWAATEIKKINYTQSYTLHDNKIQKTEEKVVLVKYLPENLKKLETFLKKADICRKIIKDINSSKNT